MASPALFYRNLHHQNFECKPKPKTKIPQEYSTETGFKPYFYLDTSLNRTLAYAHWCNWENVLERINIRSHLRFAGETVVALGATMRHRTSPSVKRSGPAHNLDPKPAEAPSQRGIKRNVDGTAPVEE
jgi:hypothetical protein